ncbi:MAG: hypothetical protein H0X26_10385 [Alphaproteobacteria bacterium]|nr:hypothetical protein [Alphaproteobacteria bacterium]
MVLQNMNRHKIIPLFALGAIIIQLSGCASPAEVSNMTTQMDNSRQASPTSPYFNNINISSVGGGSETNPLWTSQVSSEDFKSALEGTLRNARLLGSPDARYQLAAEIKELDQPLIGINMTVDMSVLYTIKDKQTGNVVFNDKINSSFTGTMGDSVVGIKRLRLANEGTVRNNFDFLLQKILKK